MSTTNNQPVIAVIGAMDEEIKILKSSLDNMQQEKIASFDYFVGDYDGKHVIVAKSDIGKVNAAIITSLLVHEFNPDIIINTGSAGGIHTSLKVGDVVIADELTYNDADVRAFGYAYGQLPGMPTTYFPDKNLIALAKQAATAVNLNTHIGLIGSGDSFISSNERINAIKEHFPEIHAVEMESTAVAQSCYRLDKPFVIIRSISDNANDDASVDFEEFLHVASKNSAEMVLTMIRHL